MTLVTMATEPMSVAEHVAASAAASGVPLKVADRDVLLALARLLRG